VAVTVVMIDADQGAAVVDTDTQFFVQFTRQTLFRGLVGFQFAARKLPESALVDVIRTPGDQDPALVVLEDPGHDVDFHRWRVVTLRASGRAEREAVPP
jgi:hypothetical protein